MPEEKNKKVSFHILIDGAFIVIVGQNALMLSKPILAMFKNNIDTFSFIAFLFIGIINTFNIVYIWLSSKQNENNYSPRYFVWDVITIVLLFMFTQICMDSFSDFKFSVKIENILFVFSLVYFIIYIGYIFWNIEEIKINKIIGIKHKKILFLNIYILLYLISLIIMIPACFINHLIYLYISFIINLIISAFIFFVFCKNFTKKED